MHLHEEGRVFWSTKPLTQSELGSLISAASCTLALYRNLGANLEHVGMSSGKMMRSIVLGVPVVASRLNSLNFVEQNRLGVLIEKPYEIPKAIETVLNARQEMRENCFKFRESNLSFDSHWHGLWQELEGLGAKSGSPTPIQNLEPSRNVQDPETLPPSGGEVLP
jgi:glycosyltransferase involved in cell wall biosynthesis